mmetsp:Transcript_66270/g.110097  ORF Transcript_66270/g.110097 Transcript_66270/m.110097 type:complete len:613 (-) Transcript_66270:258-2096(-)|eukprot:CAMPEP_0119334338 /NCGR_PEP_ID=MMETSP1333-20130426/87072_1 /TAXON_ID=418940 /ORGANISM="Scyphosphaera apsteinii, Strain RCC1455" /LENGTH=612 /DNA_ID=CAMNT_0007344605 /DNA_START=33 /DNA_END=1871 /DNA_ORIENTATION=+
MASSPENAAELVDILRSQFHGPVEPRYPYRRRSAIASKAATESSMDLLMWDKTCGVRVTAQCSKPITIGDSLPNCDISRTRCERWRTKCAGIAYDATHCRIIICLELEAASGNNCISLLTVKRQLNGGSAQKWRTTCHMRPVARCRQPIMIGDAPPRCNISRARCEEQPTKCIGFSRDADFCRTFTCPVLEKAFGNCVAFRTDNTGHYNNAMVEVSRAAAAIEKFSLAANKVSISVLGITSTAKKQCVPILAPGISSYAETDRLERTCNLSITFAINIYDGLFARSAKLSTCSQALASTGLVINMTTFPQFKGYVWRKLAPPSVAVQYDYIWLFDDDLQIDRRSFALPNVLYAIALINASIAQPSIQADERHGQYRSTDWARLRFSRKMRVDEHGLMQNQSQQIGVVAELASKIEVMTPIIRSDVWRRGVLPVLNAIPEDIISRSIGQIGAAWCGLAARVRQNAPACVVVRFPILHKNTRSMDKVRIMRHSTNLTQFAPLRASSNNYHLPLTIWLQRHTDGAFHGCERKPEENESLTKKSVFHSCWPSITSWTAYDLLHLNVHEQAPSSPAEPTSSRKALAPVVHPGTHTQAAKQHTGLSKWAKINMLLLTT